MASIRDRIALITGASSGIGRATAEAFAAEGVHLLLCARRTDRLTELADGLRATHGVRTHAFALDVQSRSDVQSTLAALPAEWSAVDILVNNAGLSRGLAKVYEDEPRNWDEMIDTNIKGLLDVSRAIIPGMVTRGRGHVVNLGSTAGHITYPNGAVYCATKAAERALSEGMKLDLMGTPVRVTSVDPGMVQTEFSEVRFRGDKERAAKVYADFTPLQPEDIADAILWVVTRPAHVNIHNILMTTIDQGNSYVFNRKS